MKDIVLFGIQGSGKGTQGDQLIEDYGFIKFETGKSLRTLAAQSSPLGKKVKGVIETGSLVSDDIIFEILEDFIQKSPKDKAIIFDGLPRNKSQFDRFNALMEKLQRDYIVLHISISEEEAIKRLQNRKICPQCKKNYPYFYTSNECEDCHVPLIQREDDTNRDAVMKRLTIYKHESMPLIQLYEQMGKAITIHGERSIEEVYLDVIQQLTAAHVLES